MERDHENQATINQQKRKISRQRDLLSGLKQRYAESDRKYLEDNMKLTDEYKRITEQFKDLQVRSLSASSCNVTGLCGQIVEIHLWEWDSEQVSR